MTPAERNYILGRLMVIWSRTLTEHQLSFEEWLSRRAKR